MLLHHAGHNKLLHHAGYNKLKCAEERERYAEVIAARKARRSAALAVATAFVKQHMPRPERIGTFCKVMENDQVKHFSRTEKTTRMHEALAGLHIPILTCTSIINIVPCPPRICAARN